MRDAQRIPAILHDIQRVWEAFPDLRLGQLLLDVVTNPTYLFYIEDDELIHRLLEFGYANAKEIVNGETR